MSANQQRAVIILSCLLVGVLGAACSEDPTGPPEDGNGDNGKPPVILQTSDWFWLNPLPQPLDLWDVTVDPSGFGVALGEFGSVVITEDAGVTWTARLLLAS
ncbi:MAG: hypothetical protein JSW50_00195, partial [Candidatus Latescibacterota bacterium]